MAKQKSRTTAHTIQGSQYDKIFKENILHALPGLIKNVLGIEVIKSEDLPEGIQHTKERKPDVLKKITDTSNSTFVLQIEFQVSNDAEMPYRMYEYHAMLVRKYRLQVKQYVMYIGKDKLNMQDALRAEAPHFRYTIIDISTIDYNIFLRQAATEEKMFAILANFGGENTETAVIKIVTGITQNAESELQRERYKNQLRVLAQLRNLAPVNMEVIMESVSTFFKEENDILYIWGEQRGLKKGLNEGLEKGNTAFVRYLLTQTNHTTEEIAQLAEVTVAFVEMVKANLH